MDAEKIAQHNNALREAEWQRMVNGAVLAVECFNDTPDDRAIIHVVQKIARLTAELDNAKIAIDGLQNTLRKEREQHHKAQDELAESADARLEQAKTIQRLTAELERSRRECEGLREAQDAMD